MKTETKLLKTALILCIIVFLYLIYRDHKIEKEVLNCEAVCENSIERATIILLEEKVKDLSKKLEKCKDKKEVDCVYRQAL